ncbi:O-phosphoseryl-tRNA(Sec) selenium transferase, putative [Ixodes scapularis]|uniref:O-phosphoseryl-tRNA(Sec) selenium transferase n=1 Tax=Ixodes scapularis TaxID=6945 RepID=B7Q860_IXOSC|nr:O-phosphoseryl-tRNA(Sec) selenium transferase, putative [Ixodes scapularis]|eukprot:XP_002412295.1 O-phosphoseryl-tRNA(Sec) selenium transferase, putative [Ixodes scapularis]
MNSDNLSLSRKYVKASYIAQASQAIVSNESKIAQLLEQGRCPEEGWDDSTIEILLQNLSLMDSNNFLGNAGVGEREARIASNLVSRRHYRLGHGIGRSGDISETQPKAAGSSLMNKLTNSMVLHLLQTMGVPATKACFVVPMATGMSLTLCMLAFRQKRPAARYVMWSRMDQKSCFKCILTAGFEPIVVQGRLFGDELHTDVAAMRAHLERIGAQNVACVMTITSCPAPRCPDSLEDVAQLCEEFQVPHLVNNAYGVQCTKCMHLIQQASRVGRLDAFVQSTDKNFMVPVGGAIIAGFDKELIETVAQMYPGRGSATPTMDLFITLLSLGTKGYLKLRKERREVFVYLTEKLREVSGKHGERFLHTPNNRISVAMSVTEDKVGEVTGIGAMLFTRFVSGSKVVSNEGTKKVGNWELEGWCLHCKSYPSSYLNAASTLGVRKNDVDVFVQRLDKVLAKAQKVQKEKCARTLGDSDEK